MKIEITKCLFPSKNGEWTGVAQPQIEGMECIGTSIINIGSQYFEQFEYIPENINLCKEGNAERQGDYITIKN